MIPGGIIGPLISAPRAVYNVVYSGSLANRNIKTDAMAQGWDGLSPASILVTIQPGCVISSSSVSTPALTTGSSWPSQSALAIINQGRIVGKGGANGSGGNVQTSTAPTVGHSCSTTS